MTNKSIKKNYIYNVSYQILKLITPLITTPYLSRVLGADGIGTVSFAESIVSYFVLFATLGITTYGQREISYVQNDIEERSRIFWNTKILEFITSGITLITYVIFAIHQQNTIIYLVLCLSIISVFFDITWYFQGLEEFGKIVLRNTIIKLLNVCYIFIFIRSKKNLILYPLGLAGFEMLGNLSLWGYLTKYLKKVDFKDINPFKDLRTVLSLFVPTIAISIYTALDKTMIGVITGSKFENGYYEQAVKVSKMVLTLVTSLGTVMIPRIGFHFNSGDKEKVKYYMYRGYRFVWMLGIPLCFGLIMCASNFVPWFFGNGYDKVVQLIQVLAFLILAIGISNVTGMQYLIPTKRQNIFTLTVILGALLNFTLNSILIHSYLSLGAAIASVAAETFIAVLQIVIVRKELSPFTIVKEGVHYFIAGIGMAMVLYLLNKCLAPSIINTGILVISGGCVYFVILIIEKDEFFVSNVKTVLNKLFRRGK